MPRTRIWGRCRSNIVFLTADAFGVLPPIARLTPDQAMYHFLSRLHRQGRRHRDRRDRAGGDLLDLLRRAVHAAPPVRLRQPAQGADRQGRRRLLAGQHRLDRRQIRRRQPHADQGDPRAAQRRARRQPRTMPSSARTPISASRCRSRCRASTARSSTRATPGPTRPITTPPRAKLVEPVHRQFRQVRGPCRRRACATPRRRGQRSSNAASAGARSSPPPDAQTSDRFDEGACRRGRRAPFFYAKRLTMTDDHEPRLFADDAAIRHIGEGMLACTPAASAEWTHEAHLATCAWLILERPDIVPERDLPRPHPPLQRERRRRERATPKAITRRSPRSSSAACGVHLARSDAARPLVERVNALLRLAGGAARLAAALLQPRAAVLAGGAAGLGRAGSGAASRMP